MSHHPMKWEETTVVDQARTPKELLLKEAIHIRLLNPPSPLSTGMGDWSCLDARWQQPGSLEAEVTRRFWWRAPTQLPVTANDATHGYKGQVLTLASYFRPEEGQSIWLKCRHSSNPVFKAGIRELPLSLAKLCGKSVYIATVILLRDTS